MYVRSRVPGSRRDDDVACTENTYVPKVEDRSPNIGERQMVMISDGHQGVPQVAEDRRRSAVANGLQPPMGTASYHSHQEPQSTGRSWQARLAPAPISEGSFGMSVIAGRSTAAALGDMASGVCSKMRTPIAPYCDGHRSESRILPRREDRRALESDRVLDAAALQDQLTRRMQLDLGGQQPRAVVVIGGGGGEGCGHARVKRERHELRTVRTGHRVDNTSLGATQSGGNVSRTTPTGHRKSAPAATLSAAVRSATWTCQACSATNSYGADTDSSAATASSNSRRHAAFGKEHCSVCMRHRPPSHGERRGGLCGPKRNGGCGEHEEQPQRRVAVTLAQIRGLEEPPEPALTREEWSVLEKKVSARGDGTSPCPICREAFQGEGQVILSCSHVFHTACLASFERFLRGKERACPLCRKVDYQKRATRQGAVAWRQRCARRLQSAYRVHRASRAYHALLRQHYTAGLGNPGRRREFLCGQAAERAGKLAAALENRGESIDRLFDEFDRGLAFSRQVFGPTTPSTDDARPSKGNVAEDTTFDDTGGRENGRPSANKACLKAEKQRWEEALRKADDRGDNECPICMCEMEALDAPGASACVNASGSSDIKTAMSVSNAGTVESAPVYPLDEGVETVGQGKTGGRGRRGRGQGGGEGPTRSGMPRVSGDRPCEGRRRRAGNAGDRRKARLLLSCSHVFHEKCLRAFEGFNIYEVHLCPVCRQSYESVDPSYSHRRVVYDHHNLHPEAANHAY